MTTEVLSPPRSTGRVLSSPRAVALVVEGLWAWYRRNWRATVMSSVLQPVMFLVAMGYGLGSQIKPGPATGGLDYVVYLAPAVLVASALQTAAFESTYPILSSFKWQQTYWGVISTPITIDQLLTGQLVWIALRLLSSGAAYLVIAALCGPLTGPGVLLALPVGVLTGMAFCSFIVALSASLNSEGQAFNAVFRFVVLPMTLFAGTYYPITQLPGWIRPLAWITPLWHGNELARTAAFGPVDWLATAMHLGYLVALLVAGVLLARWRFRVRLMV